MFIVMCLQNEKKYIYSLTGARFIAIMLIVCSHFEFLHQYGILGDIYWKYLHNATMGVDFFFMLSGFGMMLSSLRKDPRGLGDVGGFSGSISFAKRHIKKIYPIYCFMLAIGVLYEILTGIIEQGHSLWYLFIRILKCLPIDLLLLQSMTGKTGYSHSFNGVSWFLSCLFCIYLVSPFIMRFLKRHVMTVKGVMLCLIISVICAEVLALIFSYLEHITTFNDFCYGSPYRRVFYVLMGMLLAQLYHFRKQKNKHFIRFTLGRYEYFILALSMAWFFARSSFIESMGIFIYIFDMILTAGLLYVLALECGKFSAFLESSTMVYLGNISMYIFMTHYLIRMYSDFLVRLLNIQSIEVAIIEIIIILTATFWISGRLYVQNGQLDLICKLRHKFLQVK